LAIGKIKFLIQLFVSSFVNCFVFFELEEFGRMEVESTEETGARD
jgi:hypothetical protein